MDVIKLFNKPKIIGLVGDVNEGKSNTIYYLIKTLQEFGDFNLYAYGLKRKLKGSVEVKSLNEIEDVKNSIIIIDEVFSLFDLDNRKAKRDIEKSLRLIFHKNNIILLCGVGENFKKFLSAKLDIIIYKKVTFDDLINGSRVKNKILAYQGEEKGTTILGLEVGEALVFDGLHYHKIKIPYLENYDSKKGNKPIITVKK